VFLSEINLINVIRFSTLILKEIYILYNNGKIDNKKLEKYLDDTCKILLIEAHNKSKLFKEILK
ncbi:hypothetical protein F2I49_07050, partial [Campylobacter jejuni]|nr:hypothetical protein [Campylobacter jejuni]